MTGVGTSSPDPPAAAAITGWRPGGAGESAQAFARQAVGVAAPATAGRARALLFAAGRPAAFGEQIGLHARPEVLPRPSAVERLVACGVEDVSAATRRTLRPNLRFLARAAAAHPPPAPTALPRERAKRPHADVEIAGYLGLAAAQPTAGRRARAGALVCLGAGAGLVGAELRHITGEHVVERSGGLLVLVGGRRERAVPVRHGFHAALADAAAFAGARYLIGGRDPGRRNLTDLLAGVLCADSGLPRLEAGRLRATWLVACAQAIGLKAFTGAAGITCPRRLGDLVGHLPASGEPAVVRLLGGPGRARRPTWPGWRRSSTPPARPP